MMVHVEPSDELNTIIHRVRQIEDEEIVIVFPEKGDLFQDPVLMHLLSQYGKSWKKKIIIDSADPVIRHNAETAGLDVLDLKVPERPMNEGKRAGWVERLTVILVILLAFGGLTYFAVPRAVVVVTPAVHEFSERVKAPLNQLSGVQLVEVSTMITRRTPSTGRQTVGITKSTGEVVLVNQSSESILVPRGTIVTTGGDTAFLLTRDVKVPAVSTQYFMDIPTGLQAGQASAPIEALTAGSRGNVAEGRIQHIVDFDLVVRNPEPTKGGTDTVLSVSTIEDIDRARGLVERDGPHLTLEALQTAAPERIVLSDSLQFELEIMEQTPLGEETEEVFVSALSKGKVHVIDKETLRKELQSELERLLPGDFLVVDGSLEVSNFVVEGLPGAQTLEIAVQGQRRGKVSGERLIDRLIGQPRDELNKIKVDFPEIAEIEVRNFRGDKLPRWRHWLTVQIRDSSESLY